MTGRGLRGLSREWLAGFLVTAAMAGCSAGGSDSAVAKEACSRGGAEVASSGTYSVVPDTAAFGSGTIAYNRQRPDGSRAGIWVADGDGANQRRLADSGSRPVWSPDGTHIAYEESHSGGVWVMDADGTNARWLTDQGSSPVWSPDGNRIAYEEWDGGGVWVVDADGANPRWLTEAGWNPVWSPDGKFIAYNNGGIWTMDADGANHRLVADGGADAAWSPDGRRIVYYQSGVDSGSVGSGRGRRRSVVAGRRLRPGLVAGRETYHLRRRGRALRDLGCGRGRRQLAAVDPQRFEPAVVA